MASKRLFVGLKLDGLFLTLRPLLMLFLNIQTKIIKVAEILHACPARDETVKEDTLMAT